MFCSNCGKQLEDNVAFCPECGTKMAVASAAPVAETPVTETPVVEASSVETPVVQTPVAPAPAPVVPTAEKAKKKNKGPVIVIIILLLLIIALGLAIWYLMSDNYQGNRDAKESTEAFADDDEDEDEDEDEATPEPTEEPTPEPTEEPTPEPTEEPTPEPTEEPTPEPTEEPTPEPTEDPEVEPTDDPEVEPTDDPEVEPTDDPEVEPTDDPEVEPTDDPEVEPTDDPEVEPTDDPIVWNDPVFDVDASAYETCTVYENEMEESGITITDKQTILADGDIVSILMESTVIDLSDFSEDEIAIYAEVFDQTYNPIGENAPANVEVINGLDGNVYRFEMIIYLEDADLKELADAGYINITSGSAEIAKYVSYKQTCTGLEAMGYTLAE